MKPRRVNNREVARLWRAGVPARNGKDTFSTDGRKLYSYNLCIGYVNSEGDYVIINHCAGLNAEFVSVTTSQHVSLGARHADADTAPSTARVPPDEPHTSANPSHASAIDALSGHYDRRMKGHFY